MESRQSTGIPGLDQIFLGGLIPSRSYLILGDAGAGKTILSIQWLLEGNRLGEKTLYISLAESQEDIERNIHSFGWSLKGVDVIDLLPAELRLMFEEYHIFKPEEVEQTNMWEAIYQAIIEKKPQRVVIDSASQLRFLSPDKYQFRKHMVGLAKFLNKSNTTAMLIFEPADMVNDTSVALAVDGIISLRMESSPGCIIGLRYIEILKIRGTDFLSGYHPFKITNKGLYIFPHKIEKKGINSVSKDCITSGILLLDEMLGGGIEIGTTTIISGPTGSGKSTVATQFLLHGASQGIPGLIIMFEESTDFMVHRCRKIGIPLDELIQKNMVKLVRLNPMEIYPDELLAMIRHYIKHEGYKVAMIDSMRGYSLAMEAYGKGAIIPHLHNLITYLNRKQVTTFLINETQTVSGSINVTGQGISHFADNILLLNFAERKGKVLKIISCLKKRLGAFESESRELDITSNGMVLSKKLTNLEGVLSGMTRFNHTKHGFSS